jgi:hypothetical protein
VPNLHCNNFVHVLFIYADLEHLGIEKPRPPLIRISCNSLNIPKEVV